MKTPKLPDGWVWDKIKTTDWRNWDFKLYELKVFDEHYQSITTQIGPFIWQCKSRKIEDMVKS